MKVSFNGKTIHLLQKLSPEERETAEKQIKENARGTSSFYIMVLISTIIITGGLIANNSAVVIGGMIIAPLIWPLLALSIAAVHWQKRNLRTNFYTLLKTVVVVLVISFLVGLFYPLYDLGDQVMRRTEPNIVDLVIALAAGLGGAFSTIYSRRSPTIFGVAVAVALVPPLCTAGILFGSGRWNLVGGALLLFLTNLIAIIISAMFIFIMAKFSGPRTKEGEEKRKKVIIYSLISFLIISIPLIFLTWNVINLSQTRIDTKELFVELHPQDSMKNLQISKTRKFYTVSAEIYSANNITTADIDEFTTYLSKKLDKKVYTNFTIIKVKQLNRSSK